MRHIKQWHRVAIVVVFLSLRCNVAVSAFDFSVNNIYYNINDKTLTAEVTYADNAYNSYSGRVVIPATVNNGGKTYKVTAVGDNAFRDCSGLTSVVFGSNLETIGKRAFLNCSSLTSVNITGAVTEIDDYAFAQCDALITVQMNNNAPLEVGNGAFMRCSSLKNVKWLSCKNLEGYGGLNSLETNAFAHCTSLVNIMLPGAIEYMGTTIFDGCTKLTSITVTVDQPLPLSGDPFALSSSVTIYVPSSGQAGVSAALYQNAVGWSNYTIAELPYSFIDGDGYTYLKTSYGSVALSGAQTPKTEVEVRNSITGYSGENYNVTSIGDQAFKGSAIASINTSNAFHLKSIGIESFANCTSLVSVSLTEGITTMGERAFASCTALTTIMSPSTLRIISKGSFEGCSSLNDVRLLLGLSTICENAFAHCTSLTSLSLPSSVTCVEPKAFKGTSALQEILVDPHCFSYVAVEGVLYEKKYVENPEPEAADEINKLAVYPSNKAGEVLYIPPGVTEIKPAAIQDAINLKQVAIPPTTTVFGENCFDGTNLQFINYRCKHPSNAGTSGITAVLKANATLQVPEGTMGEYSSLSAWKGFKSIVERYDVCGDNKFVYDWNYSNQVTLVDIKPAAVNSSGTVSLPLGMTLNGLDYVITELKNTSTAQVAQQVKNLRIGCDSLSVIDLSNDINPLAALTSLQTISISDNHPYFKISDNVLYNKKGNLLYYYLHSKAQESFTLPNTVDTIKSQAFAQNTKLKVLTSEKALKYISNKAFEGCTSLQVLDNMKYVTVIGNHAFAGCTALTTVNGGERLNSIGSGAFLNCNNLREFPFCHGMLTNIGTQAFKGCSSLTVAILGSMLSSIGDGAFEDCTALGKAFFTSDVNYMGHQLFKGCSSLSELWLCNTVPPQVGNDFFTSPASIVLYVPQDAASAYRTTSPWKNVAQINTCHYLDNSADVNNDKAVNAYDITLVYSVLLGVEDIDMVGHCDVNHDGAVTASDITLVYDYILTGDDVTMAYRFINEKNESVGQYILMVGNNNKIRAIDHATDNYVTSGLMGVSDNPYITSITSGTNQGVQYLEMMPLTPGYLTLVLIVNNGITCHYRAFPLVVR
ncbi:MAG: leucine-rich repeat protein [Muribaculaceae bacterium]|nr:leucine-rich repeat protein [Muribaculaceae bacterium]